MCAIFGADTRTRPSSPTRNTSAAVKAECDICCTSSNAVEVVESLDSDRVIFLPDGHLARYVAAQTDVEIIDWQGVCVVHDEFRASDLRALRRQYPDISVAVHPECNDQVQKEADMVGSTSQLRRHIADERPDKVALITECTMSGNLSAEFPETDFVQPCSLCRVLLDATAFAARPRAAPTDPHRMGAKQDNARRGARPDVATRRPRARRLAPTLQRGVMDVGEPRRDAKVVAVELLAGRKTGSDGQRGVQEVARSDGLDAEPWTRNAKSTGAWKGGTLHAAPRQSAWKARENAETTTACGRYAIRASLRRHTSPVGSKNDRFCLFHPRLSGR
ncbi:MAG: quinolinate synthase NadA [Persicimonas sp.]